MPRELLEFWWDVLAGYRLVEGWLELEGGTGQKRLLLSLGEPRVPPRPSSSRSATRGRRYPEKLEVKRYPPLRTEPALFRTFAFLNPTPDSILAFAKEYGHLGVEMDHSGNFVARPGEARYENPVEPIDVWQDEIRAMRDVVTVVDLVKDRDYDQLRSRLTKDEKSGRFTFSTLVQDQHDLWPWEGFSTIWVEPDPGIMKLGTAILERQAWLFIQEAANAHLHQHRPSVDVRWPRGESTPQLFVVPENLLQAMWLQFAEALGGSRDFHRCDREGCGRWFERAPQARRRSATYCSTACRNRAWRDRRPAGVLRTHSKRDRST